MSERVRAAVQIAPRQIELREFPRPKIGPDDGLLRVEANGICGSDVEVYNGHMGSGERRAFVPGHEPLGIIEEIGDRAAERWGVQPGDRVARETISPCRACLDCLTGRYQSCRNRKYGRGETGADVAPYLWGGMAEYMYLPPYCVLHKIDKGLPVDVAAMYNPVGAGVRWALHLGEVGLGDTVLILGAGQRGIAAAIAARAAGAATVIITGLEADAHKLALAQQLGADHALVVDGAAAQDVVERVREITGGAMADVVLELTPMAAQPITDAFRAARHGGRVVLAGLKGEREILLSTDLIIRGALTVRGAFGVDARGMQAAIALLESGTVPFAAMHTHTFGLADAELAIQTLAGEIPGESAVHVSIQPGA